jgi:hypothetical protein
MYVQLAGRLMDKEIYVKKSPACVSEHELRTNRPNDYRAGDSNTEVICRGWPGRMPSIEIPNPATKPESLES